MLKNNCLNFGLFRIPSLPISPGVIYDRRLDVLEDLPKPLARPRSTAFRAGGSAGSTDSEEAVEGLARLLLTGSGK